MQIKVRPFSSEEVERFCDFSETYYDQMETNDVSFVTWKMKCNTSQPAEHLTIEEDGKMLGRAALFTRTYVTEIGSFTATQVTDLLVKPNVANPAIMITLVKNYTKLEPDFSFNTSNEKSDLIYRKLFKFEKVIEMVNLAVPLRTSRFLKDRLGPLSAPVAWVADAVLSSLWLAVEWILEALSGLESATRDSPCANQQFFDDFREACPRQILRSSEFMRERYEQSIFDYRFIHITNAGKMIAQAPIRVAEFSGIRALVVLDVLSSEKLGSNIRRSLMKELLKQARETKSDLIYWLQNDNCEYLKPLYRFPLVKVPSSLLPHPTPIYFKSLNSNLNGTDFHDSYISLGDLDYF